MIAPKKHQEKTATLHDACVKLKEHIVELVAVELRNTNFMKGFDGLSKLSGSDLENLQKISRQEKISDQDIEHVVSKLLGSAAPAKFIDRHRSLADALEKYRAVNDLLTAKDDASFRAKYWYHVSSKTLDGENIAFLSTISQHKFFKPKETTKEDNALATDDVKTSTNTPTNN
jgi:hypothetical protein